MKFYLLNFSFFWHRAVYKMGVKLDAKKEKFLSFGKFPFSGTGPYLERHGGGSILSPKCPYDRCRGRRPVAILGAGSISIPNVPKRDVDNWHKWIPLNMQIGGIWQSTYT